MSRGKFLGVGVVAAAGVGVGVRPAADDPAVTEIDETSACAEPRCGEYLNDESLETEWEIPASILNMIWGEIWPRWVALGWQLGTALTPKITIGDVKLKADATPSDDSFEEVLDELILLDSGGLFEMRATSVLDYIKDPTKKHIPIRFLGEGAYDFVLSDYGLDLFAPPEPTSVRELLRYYRFRRTGRPTLGVPGYLDGTLTFALDSPTGPSQILTNKALLEATELSSSCTMVNLSCFWPLEDLPLDPNRRQTEAGLDGSFNQSEFLVAAGKARCWQVEGAVYRGILNDLPRLVAEIWIERLDGVPPGETYNEQFVDGEHVASIFEERLETSLPEDSVMKCHVVAGLLDVMISNHGFEFPEVDDKDAVALTTWRNDMCGAIAEGKAGNPVFTDSKRPPGAGI